MKEAESKITGFVHLLKREKTKNKKKRAQVSNACMFAVAQDAANASVCVRRACYGADMICIFPSPRCLLPTALALMLVSRARIDCMGQGARCETAGRHARKLLAAN